MLTINIYSNYKVLYTGICHLNRFCSNSVYMTLPGNAHVMITVYTPFIDTCLAPDYGSVFILSCMQHIL